MRYIRMERTTKLYHAMKAYHASVLTYAGRSEWWIDGETGVQTRGSLQVEEPGQVRRDLRCDVPSTFQVLTFDAHLVDSAREALGIGPHAHLEKVDVAQGDPRARPILRLHALAHDPTDGFTIETAIAEAATAFASYLKDRRIGDRERRLRSNVRRARQFLLDHMSEPITLDALSEHARMDKFHLCRAFTTEVGLPPYAFLTHVRIARGCVLLRRGVRPSELASQIGFCDQSQMHRHFVRIVGLTPGAYANAV